MPVNPSSFRGTAIASIRHVRAETVDALDARKMFGIRADLFERGEQQARSVELSIFRGRLLIREGAVSRTIPLDSIRLSHRGEELGSEVVLPDGGTCKIPDGRAFASMMNPTHEAKACTATRYQRASIVLLSLVLVAFIVQSIWQVAPHYLASELAAKLPASWVKASSVRVVTQLDQTLLHPSELSESTRQLLIDQFASLQPPIEGAPPYRLLLRKSDELGAACFSLPNGDIVLTDAFWTSTPRSDLRLWLMLRSLGHLWYRHALVNVAQTHFHSLLFAMLTGDKEGGVRAIEQGLRETRYSLTQSGEADAYASRMLRANATFRAGVGPTPTVNRSSMLDAPQPLRQALENDRTIPEVIPPNKP